jgi:hypothetical protein
MTHAAYRRPIEREISALSRAPFHLSFRDMQSVLAGRRTTDAVMACQVFAKTRQWPKMSDFTRFEVCARLSCAEWYCAKTHMADVDTEAEEEEFYVSLLVEYYDDVGREDWIADAMIPKGSANDPSLS